MSTLAVATIKSASSAPTVFQNSSGTEIGQLVFAYANIETSGTASIAQSFNISSVTELNGDHYRLVFSRSASNANYAIGCDIQVEMNHFTRDHTSSQFDFRTGGQLSDQNFSVIVAGD